MANAMEDQRSEERAERLRSDLKELLGDAPVRTYDDVARRQQADELAEKIRAPARVRGTRP